MNLTTASFLTWAGSTTGGMFFCMFACIGISVLGGLANPFEAIKRSLIRSGILWHWERDTRICTLRRMLETNGVITEPVTTPDGVCRVCEHGFAMALECDLMRRRRHFAGIILRCASCGQSVDRQPGPTLEELAVEYACRQAGKTV